MENLNKKKPKIYIDKPAFITDRYLQEEVKTEEQILYESTHPKWLVESLYRYYGKAEMSKYWTTK